MAINLAAHNCKIYRICSWKTGLEPVVTSLVQDWKRLQSWSFLVLVQSFEVLENVWTGLGLNLFVLGQKTGLDRTFKHYWPHSVTPVIGEFLSEKLLKSSEILSETRHWIIKNYQKFSLTDNRTEIFYMDFNFWCNISWCITVLLRPLKTQGPKLLYQDCDSVCVCVRCFGFSWGTWSLFCILHTFTFIPSHFWCEGFTVLDHGDRDSD